MTPIRRKRWEEQKCPRSAPRNKDICWNVKEERPGRDLDKARHTKREPEQRLGEQQKKILLKKGNAWQHRHHKEITSEKLYFPFNFLTMLSHSLGRHQLRTLLSVKQNKGCRERQLALCEFYKEPDLRLVGRIQSSPSRASLTFLPEQLFFVGTG